MRLQLFWRLACLGLCCHAVLNFPLPPINYTIFEAYPVPDNCPLDKPAWENASDSLNCSKPGTSRENLYHCLPNKNKTQLLQFCYPFPRHRMTPGKCFVVADNGRITSDDCSSFIDNQCQMSYDDVTSSIYKYPECLKINPKFGCYTSEPDCPDPIEMNSSEASETTTFSSKASKTTTVSTVSTVTTETSDTSPKNVDNQGPSAEDGNSVVIPVAIAISVTVVVITSILIVYFCCKRNKKKTRNNHFLGQNPVNREPIQGDLPESSVEEFEGTALLNDSSVNNPIVCDETDALNHSGVRYPESEVHNVQSKTKTILQRHLRDETYVKTTAVNEALRVLKEKHVVILTGKEGEGKTKASYQVLREMSQKGFVALNVSSCDQWSRIVDADCQCAVLLDDVVSAANKSRSFLDEILSCAEGGNVNVIIVCREKELEELKTIHPVCELFGTPDYTINLSSSFTLKTEEKRQILRQYEMARKRELADEDREEILNTDTFFGFPYTCSLFFAQDDFFNQGPSFFSHTNRELLDRIKRLRNMNASITKKGLYCVLCYVFENGSLDISQINEQLLAEIAVIIRVPEIRPCDVSDAVSDLKGVYLMETSETNVYDFIHETVREAVCISYGELDLRRVIEKCPRKTLNAVARIANYQERPEEIVFKISRGNYDAFARRMLLDDLEEEKIVTNIIVNHFSSDSDFVKVLLTCAVPPSCDMPKILRMLWDRLITDRHTALLENMLEIYGPHIAAFSQQSGNRIDFRINRDDMDGLIQRCLNFQKEDKILVLMKYVRKHEHLHDIDSFIYTHKRSSMTLLQFCENNEWVNVIGELQAIKQMEQSVKKTLDRQT